MPQKAAVFKPFLLPFEGHYIESGANTTIG